ARLTHGAEGIGSPSDGWNAYGNPIQNVYIRRVERRGGILQNTVIYTYERVSQFWKYDPQEFLRQPVYSRDFPPCRYCGQ
ncbi:MAG: hypothetical protein QN166_03875, partial [Armatimonadota bacterium]|nr:hypothetical protein [Armatimonadota bacterium]